MFASSCVSVFVVNTCSTVSSAPISIAHVQGVLSALAIELELNETETKTLLSQFKRTNGKLFLKLTKQDVVERMDKAGLDDVEILQAVCHKIQSFTSQHAGSLLLSARTHSHSSNTHIQFPVHTYSAPGSSSA